MNQDYKYLLIEQKDEERIITLIRKLVKRRRFLILNKLLHRIPPSVIASLWNSFNKLEQIHIINTLNIESSAEVLAELSTSDRGAIFKNKDSKWILDRLGELASDDVVDILKELPHTEVNFIIRKFSKKYSQKIKLLLQYEEKVAGSLMSSDFFAVNSKATIENIVQLFRKYAAKEDLEYLHFIDVVDDKNRLEGYIPIRKIITEKPNKKAMSIMSKPIVTILPDMDKEEVVRIFKTYDIISLPVVDKDGILLGRIFVDDVFEIMEQEVSEDAFMMAGLPKNESLSDSLFVSIKNRFPWMLVNFFSMCIAASVVHYFQFTLEKYIILAVFMPIIAALSGAIGNQMVTLVIREVMVKSFHITILKKFMIRELVAIIFGAIIVGTLLGGVAYFIGAENIYLGIVVTLSLILTMFFSTLIGIGVPILLQALKFDPALGSSIISTALTDLTSFFIFLKLADIILV